jgi:two-component system cell cycle response regulator DivK
MPSPDKTSVIVVDDTDESREMILRMLQFDATIEVVGKGRTGVEAIEAAQKLKPDVIVMDINMPDVDGYTLTSKLKTVPGIRQIPIIAITANAMRGDRERSLRAGCDGYIEKPINIDTFIDQIGFFLARFNSSHSVNN